MWPTILLENAGEDESYTVCTSWYLDEIDALSVPVANVPQVKTVKMWLCPFSAQSP